MDGGFGEGGEFGDALRAGSGSVREVVKGWMGRSSKREVSIGVEYGWDTVIDRGAEERGWVYR